MLNYIWAGMILMSFICALTGSGMAELTAAVTASAAKAAELVIKVASMLCVWGGVMEICADSGLSEAVGRLMSPVLRLIFPSLGKNSEAMKYISMNLSANLMGLSNAATPPGLEAMRRLNDENPDPTRASADMIVFVVMNSASLRLIPTTAAMLRQQAGSVAPMEILPASALTSVCALTAAIAAARLGSFFAARRGGHG